MSCHAPLCPPSKPAARPRQHGSLVLCPGTLANATAIERHFRERGWRVLHADNGGELRRLVREEPATVALIAEEIPGEESAWVTCWKLLSELPEARVIVLGDTHVERGSQRARYVGASAYVNAGEPAAGVYRTVRSLEASVA